MMKEEEEEEETSPVSMQSGVVNLGFNVTEEITDVEAIPNDRVYSNTTVKEVPEDELYGWLCLKPRSLQRLRTKKWVLFWMCWVATVQGFVVNGFINVCITTIERRYHLNSASAGIIAGSYDVGAVFSTIVVSYLGSLPGASKPRWLGWGLLIMGLGSFTFASPHFVTPYYHLSLSNQDATTDILLCLKEQNYTSVCEEKAEKWLSSFRYVFIFGQFLHGIGSAPIYTLGVTYLDESVPFKMSSFYLGIFHSMAVIGPALGFVVGGQLLDVYINAANIDPTEFGILQGSDQWLGAWWIGFVIAGTMAFCLSWVIMGFPANIPGGDERAQERVTASVEATTQTFHKIQDLPRASKVLFTNYSFVCIGLAEASEGLILSGLATFMPKIMESQFSLSAGRASILVGLITVPAGGGGTFLGGWIGKRFKMNCEDVLKFCYFISFLCFICSVFFILTCPNVPFAGVNESYINGSTLNSVNLDSSCNSDCNCTNDAFDPVCGANKFLYFSPCYAGCKTYQTLEGIQIYSDCQCILDSTRNSSSGEPVFLPDQDEPVLLPGDSAIRQKCPSDCDFLTIFLVILFILLTFTFIISMPTVTATLRCVPDNYRSYAMGMNGIITRCLGTIPGPVLFGYVIDNSCVLWHESCDVIGSCRSYDNYKLSRSIMTVLLVFKACSTFFYFSSWMFFKRRKSIIEKQKTKSKEENSAVQK